MVTQQRFSFYSAPNISNTMPLILDEHAPCAPEVELGPDDWHFWIYIGIIVSLVTLDGTMTGLALGLLSLDVMSLRVLVEAGTDSAKKHAKRILPLVRRHHLLLVTLLLASSIAAESLPIFLDRITNPVSAVAISATAVFLFAGVLPQALCTRYGLTIGATLSPLVYFLMVLLFPIGYPFAKLLDLLLGHKNKTFFRRAELKALVSLHGSAVSDLARIQSIVESYDAAAANAVEEEEERYSAKSQNRPVLVSSESRAQYLAGNEDPLTCNEVLIIKGALEMRDKTAASALVPLEYVFALDVDRVLDNETLAEIEERHHSHIPLYDGSRHNIIGCLLVRQLLRLNASDKVSVKQLTVTDAVRRVLHVDVNIPLYQLLSEFKTGSSKMAIVHEAVDDELVENQAAQDAVFEASQISSSDVIRRLNVKRRAMFKLADTTSSPVVGIVTFEDVIEELLQQEILDEMDFDVKHSLKLKNVTEAVAALTDTANHIRRLRHAGVSVMSRQSSVLPTPAKTTKKPSLGRSISSNILLARSRVPATHFTLPPDPEPSSTILNETVEKTPSSGKRVTFSISSPVPPVVEENLDGSDTQPLISVDEE